VIRTPLRFDPKSGEVVSGKGEAGNLFRLLHHLFGKALAWKVRPPEAGHPLDGLEQPRVRRREHLLSDEEVGALLAELDRSERDKLERPEAVQVIRAIAYLGWRISEVLGLQRAYIRADLAEAHLPDTKGGYSARPLSPEALALLLAIERRPGVPWLFPGVTDARRPLAYSTVKKAFDAIAERVGITGATPHTLRHRFTTDVANAAENIRAGMAATGHKSVAAFMNYVHAERRQAQAVVALGGSRLAGVAAKPRPEKIMELPSQVPSRRRN
jgi:integrase